jgi:hypothetical protein
MRPTPECGLGEMSRPFRDTHSLPSVHIILLINRVNYFYIPERGADLQVSVSAILLCCQ